MSEGIVLAIPFNAIVAVNAAKTKIKIVTKLKLL
jgi:hypothetical protein